MAALKKVCNAVPCGVSAFLALVWLAEPWLPLFPVPSDVITLRFLLFLGHTYGAVLLLTVPLIAMETACKLLLVPAGKSWTDKGGPRGGGGDGSREGEGPETGGNWSAAHGDAAVGERAPLFSPVPGFLCSVLAWALCGVWGGRRYTSAQPYVEDCVLRTGSLSLCLPDLATITQAASSDPSLTLPTFVLLLALPVSLSTLRRGRTRVQTHLRAAIDKEAPHVHVAVVQPCGPKATPPPATTITHQPCLSTELDRGQSPSAMCCGRVNRQMPSDPCQRNVTAHTRRTCRSSTLRAQLSSALCGPAGPETRTHSSRRTLGLSLLAGLLCAGALYLLPPCLAVNPILISSMGSLAERTLKH